MASVTVLRRREGPPAVGDKPEEYDDQTGTGTATRARMRGWTKHLHGFDCPRCGSTERDRERRNRHDSWHREDDEYHDDWAAEVEFLRAELARLCRWVNMPSELVPDEGE